MIRLDAYEASTRLLRHFAKHGFQAYRVGGAVRDKLLNLELHDIDIATNARPDQVMKLVKRSIPTGIQYGTVTVIWEGISFEVTTFRSEGNYANFRRPETVSFSDTLEEDLSRRDFTINAMAEDVDGRLIDPFCGKQDMERGIIRAVGHADERMSEDALRMLRAVRFAARFNFKIEKGTVAAIQKHADNLKHVAIERIQKELCSILKSTDCQKGFRLLYKLRLWPVLFKAGYPKTPFPSVKEQDAFLRWQEATAMTTSFQAQKGLWKEWDMLWEGFLWACLLDWQDFETLNAEVELRRWRLSKNLIHVAAKFLSIKEIVHRPSIDEISIEQIHRLLLDFPIELVSVVLSNEEWKQINGYYMEMPIHHKSELKVSGKDLSEQLQKPAGPWIEHMLDQLLWETATQSLNNDREALLLRAKVLMEQKERRT